MIRRTALALSFSLSLAALPAQQQATTLALLAERAAAIATVTVLGNSDPSPEFCRIEFEVLAVLRGTLPQRIALTEPAGRCCGHALFALQPGDRRLLFLERRGPLLHALGGDRGVVLADDDVVRHVAALLLATDESQRLARLAEALESPSERVAGDAALALASRAAVPADPRSLERILRALERELGRGSAHAPALVDVAVRCGDRSTVEALVHHLYAARRPDQVRLLRDGLAACDGDRVRQALSLAPPPDDGGVLRAAELLQAIPSAQNRALLERLLVSHSAPRVQLALCEALLAAGTAPVDLRARVPAPVVDLAERRRAAVPRFRNVHDR